METNDTRGGERLRAREEAADRRVRVALRSIEEAQRLLDQATQALCSVKGLVIEWKKVGAAYDQVKGCWYAVEKRAVALRPRGRLILDHEPGSEETDWAALLEGEDR